MSPHDNSIEFLLQMFEDLVIWLLPLQVFKHQERVLGLSMACGLEWEGVVSGVEQIPGPPPVRRTILSPGDMTTVNVTLHLGLRLEAGCKCKVHS